MDINELMIGDWVTGKKWIENPFKLTRINDNGKYYYGVTSKGLQVGPFLIEEFKPIPITPEILKKNGFVYDNYYHCWIYDEFTINYGHLLEDNDYLFIWVADTPKKLIYVHELQHTLRLCKIEREIIL